MGVGMMSVHENIRAVRRAKGLTQEEVAEKLDMSVNGYGDIERGLCDIKLTRLQQIAELFDVELSAFLDEGKNILSLIATNNTGTQHNQNHCIINPGSQDYSELQNELEKQRLICSHQLREIELQNQEINYLKEINQLLKNGST